MKTYIVRSYTNYGEVVHIINADDEKDAGDMAKEYGAWDDCDVEEIDTATRGLSCVGGGDGG